MSPDTKQSLEDCFVPGESERHAGREVDESERHAAAAHLVQRFAKLIVFLLPGRDIQG